MISEKPVVQGACQGVPIWRLGYTWVLGEAPNLVDEVPLQVGNTTACRKVHPKKSTELRSNYLGANSSRMPRTPANDYLPLEPIHLIDGNPETCWSSRTQSQPNAEPVWIRLDLPVERIVSRIVLRKRKPGAARNQVGSMPLDAGAVEVGRGMPYALTIKLSRDGWHWDTVYQDDSGESPEREAFELDLAPQPAKQIWIIGEYLPRVENWLYAFSIASVEVYDTRGRNVALATEGTGVTVNSTMHSFGQELPAQRWYWPLYHDAGFKWARMGYHDDPINWHWVEKERGQLAMDPEADTAVTELVESGVNVIMALGFGNRLYTQPGEARKLPQLWEWYYENPAPPTTPEALEAWGRYVRYMAEHFRDRVRVFEVWNEWNIPVYWGGEPSAAHYLAVACTAIPILREVCPQAKIMLGSWAGFPSGIGTWSAEELAAKEQELLYLRVTHELAREVDVIGWHPFYQTDTALPRFRTYAADVRALRKLLAQWGFQGECMATEWNYGANYPPTDPPNWWGDFAASEIEKAKYVAQLTVKHTALNLVSCFCEMHNAVYPLDLSLLRRAFAADPIPSLQPQAAYYVLRNLATALEDLEPAEFAYRLATSAEVECYALGTEQERVLALWQPGRAHDTCEGTPIDVWVGLPCASVSGYDLINGTLQELVLEERDGGVLLRGILVRDYPLLLRFR
jgi:hypothetical protein